MRVAWIATIKTAYLFIVLIMQENTKVTVKLMRLPAHKIRCLPSLSSQIWFLSRCATFQLVFSIAGTLKRWAFIRQLRARYVDISLITLITLVRDKIYGSLILHRKNAPKEFQGNLVEIDFSLAQPSGNCCKIYFCCVCEILLHQCYIVESLGKIQLCNIIHAKYTLVHRETGNLSDLFEWRQLPSPRMFSSSLGDTRWKKAISEIHLSVAVRMSRAKSSRNDYR